jgi:hypothetical protein
MVEDLYADWRETKQHIKAPTDRINNLINQYDLRHPDYSNLNKWGALQYRRQFIGSLQRYGRLHNSFQNESNREMLTIDGSPIAEVDVHASALKFLQDIPKLNSLFPMSEISTKQASCRT